jgi:hypothetical protein
LFRHTCVVILLQESAIDFTEIEEALVLVKQKKQKSIPDPDFLQKVDVEMSKGKYCDTKSGSYLLLDISTSTFCITIFTFRHFNIHFLYHNIYL